MTAPLRSGVNGYAFVRFCYRLGSVGFKKA